MPLDDAIVQRRVAESWWYFSKGLSEDKEAVPASACKMVLIRQEQQIALALISPLPATIYSVKRRAAN